MTFVSPADRMHIDKRQTYTYRCVNANSTINSKAKHIYNLRTRHWLKDTFSVPIPNTYLTDEHKSATERMNTITLMYLDAVCYLTLRNFLNGRLDRSPVFAMKLLPFILNV